METPTKTFTAYGTEPPWMTDRYRAGDAAAPWSAGSAPDKREHSGKTSIIQETWEGCEKESRHWCGTGASHRPALRQTCWTVSLHVGHLMLSNLTGWLLIYKTVHRFLKVTVCPKKENGVPQKRIGFMKPCVHTPTSSFPLQITDHLEVCAGGFYTFIHQPTIYYKWSMQRTSWKVLHISEFLHWIMVPEETGKRNRRVCGWGGGKENILFGVLMCQDEWVM